MLPSGHNQWLKILEQSLNNILYFYQLFPLTILQSGFSLAGPG